MNNRHLLYLSSPRLIQLHVDYFRIVDGVDIFVTREKHDDYALYTDDEGAVIVKLKYENRMHIRQCVIEWKEKTCYIC